MTYEIREIVADDDDALRAAWPVMAQLRPHLGNAETFIAQVRTQMHEDVFRLAAAVDGDGSIRALAGFRVQTMLVRGRALYVDDLVSDDRVRSQGYGATLFEWLLAEARHLDCAELHLDSGVQRFDAHRFYLRQRMAITAHHFTLKIKSPER